MNWKQEKKHADKKCIFCGESDYSLLDVHRLEAGGIYSEWNTVTSCANCHRKCHSGRINILGKFNSTGGVLLHYIEDNEEKMIKLT